MPKRRKRRGKRRVEREGKIKKGKRGEKIQGNFKEAGGGRMMMLV